MVFFDSALNKAWERWLQLLKQKQKNKKEDSPVIPDVTKQISMIVEDGVLVEESALPRQHEPSGGFERSSEVIGGGVQSVAGDRILQMAFHLFGCAVMDTYRPRVVVCTDVESVGPLGNRGQFDLKAAGMYRYKFQFEFPVHRCTWSFGERKAFQISKCASKF